MNLDSKKFTAVFPGQGSQRAGMGQDFFEAYPSVRMIFERAGNSIGVDLAEICFKENPLLNETEHTQPAVLVFEMAVLQIILETCPVHFDCFAGHSLGEYSALCAAGVFELEDAVRLVQKRGQLMQRAVPLGEGLMSAVVGEGILNKDIRSVAENFGAEIANINSDTQIVLSGRKDSVEKAGEECLKIFPELFIFPLTVSAPFHSSLMKPIEKEFSEYLNSVPMKKENSARVLSNYTGDFHRPEELHSSLVNQIHGQVLWMQNMQKIRLLEQPVIEIGPAKTLSKFLESMDIPVKSVSNIQTLKKLVSLFEP